MAPDAEFLTSLEVAARLKVDRSTVTRWITTGHLKAWEIPGGKYRIPVSEIERITQLAEYPGVEPASAASPEPESEAVA